MKISIAMATFNGARFLQAQLNSILSQELVPNEVVISDDNSTDQTFEILEKFKRSAAFEVILLKNRGQPGYTQNFATALAHTTGDLIFLCDQDDVWHECKVIKVVELASKYPEHLAFMNDAELTDAGLTPAGVTKLAQMKAAGLSSSDFVMGCCSAIRRSLLDFCLPIPREFKGHDNWIIGISNGLEATLISEESLQYYRRHGENTSVLLINTLKPISRFAVLRGLFLKFFKKSGNSDLVDLKSRTFLFVERVRKLKESAPLYKEAFAIFERTLTTNLELIEVRMRIRNCNLIKRLAILSSKSNRRLYGKKGSMKKIVRDILA